MSHRPRFMFLTRFRRVVSERTTVQLAIHCVRDREEAVMMAMGELHRGMIVADVEVVLLDSPAAREWLKVTFAPDYIDRLRGEADLLAAWTFTVTT